MSKSIERLLDFEGKNICLVFADGGWWIPVKPVCEALGVDYQAQHKAILNDEILSQLSSEQTTVAADGKQRKMVCLPEMFIYGWLFSIRSESPNLHVYKMKCYQVLYNHFHGILKTRFDVLSQFDLIDIEMEELKTTLLESDEMKRIAELKKKKSGLGYQLKNLDKDLKSGQTLMNL